MNRKEVLAASEVLLADDSGPCECRRSPFDKHNVNPPCSTRRHAEMLAEAMLEAARAAAPTHMVTRTPVANIEGLPVGVLFISPGKSREYPEIDDHTVWEVIATNKAQLVSHNSGETECLDWIQKFGTAAGFHVLGGTP
jgi:hypothetical protein